MLKSSLDFAKKPEKYFLYNYKKAKNFFNICFKFGLNNIILSSTASVYGNQKQKPLCISLFH